MPETEPVDNTDKITPLPVPRQPWRGDNPPPPKELVTKLAKVMEAVGRVEKHGHNERFNYDFARATDVVDAVRNELAKQGVMIFPSIGWRNIKVTPRKTTNGETWLYDVPFTFTFIDGESGSMWPVEWYAQSMDAQDKAIYKALTGALKYLLLDTFLIATGDDPENEDAPPPKAPAGRAAARSSPPVHVPGGNPPFPATPPPAAPKAEPKGPEAPAPGSASATPATPAQMAELRARYAEQQFPGALAYVVNKYFMGGKTPDNLTLSDYNILMGKYATWLPGAVKAIAAREPEPANA